MPLVSTPSDSSNTSAPTAAIILIGNELLSGRTQDTNLAYMATRLAAHGIRVAESRIIPDDESVIIATVNTLRNTNTYVFTTGGIGPTHDDITADCIARAFNVDIAINAEAERVLQLFWAERNVQPNEDRLRMARIPNGATLVDNPVSAAPGFCMENVYVFAGVPRIMQAMFDSVLPQLQRGQVIGSVSVQCDLGEGTIAAPLRALQERYPEVDLGSYPGRMEGLSMVMLVARSSSEQALEKVEQALIKLVNDAGGKISI